MKIENKDNFLKRSMETLGDIYTMLTELPSIRLEDLQPDKTAFFIVDMINGFAREGALKSPRVEGLIPDITELSRKCDSLGIQKLAFADCHTDVSPEFGAYPVHCVVGTSEAEVVSEIKEVGGYKLIAKNSTNGFHEEEFQEWLKNNQRIDTFILTGDCTDICVQQLATTLKTWFNKQNMKSRVIVPENAVETYDLGLHEGDLIHVMALFNMITNGIEVVKEIR